MRKNIILTGQPKSGKSTLLKKIIQEIPNKVGFVTNEMRLGDNRVGFEMETSFGDKEILAHIDFTTQYMVSKYFVDTHNLDKITEKIQDFNMNDFLYIDEIGQMELFSEKFKELVLSYLNSTNTCITTLTAVFDDDFIQKIKNRKDIILVELTMENRQENEVFISQLIRKIEKAKLYVSEPDRFTKTSSGIELKSEHDTRNLKYSGDKLSCDCTFYSMYGVCSHVIATEEWFISRK